jgi:hypothetical protein
MPLVQMITFIAASRSAQRAKDGRTQARRPAPNG